MIKIRLIIFLTAITVTAMGQITANKFSKYWGDFIEQKVTNQSNWQVWYDSDHLWTIHTIGNKMSEEENSPFGDFIKQKENLRYRKEDGLTDLSFASLKSFENVLSITDNTNDSIPTVTDEVFYPIQYEILVEHENNIYACYEEMIKLAYERARLKVLITYNENADEHSDYKSFMDGLIKNFKNIISQANQKYPENMDTEYLLIIGQLDNNRLLWYSYTFNSKGNLK